MKLFFTLAVVLCGVCTAQCDEKPDRDFEFYSLFDTTWKSGQLVPNSGAYATSIENVVNWFEEGGFTAKGSAARLNDLYMERCFVQDARQTSAEVALTTIKDTKAIDVEDLNLATHLAGIAWVRQAMWTNKYVKDSVRRMFIVVTQGYHKSADQLAPPNSEDITFSAAALADTLEIDCPLQYFPPSSQVAEAIQGSQAGLLFVYYPRTISDSGAVELWRSYFADISLTDVLVPQVEIASVSLPNLTEPFLFQMVCPSWIATTSTSSAAPILYDSRVVELCLTDTRPCDPCNTESDSWREEFKDCVHTA